MLFAELSRAEGGRVGGGDKDGAGGKGWVGSAGQKGWEWKFRYEHWWGKRQKLRGRGVSVIIGPDGVCVIRYLSDHQAFKSMAGLKALCVCVSESLLMKLLWPRLISQMLRIWAAAASPMGQSFQVTVLHLPVPSMPAFSFPRVSRCWQNSCGVRRIARRHPHSISLLLFFYFACQAQERHGDIIPLPQSWNSLQNVLCRLRRVRRWFQLFIVSSHPSRASSVGARFHRGSFKRHRLTNQQNVPVIVLHSCSLNLTKKGLNVSFFWHLNWQTLLSVSVSLQRVCCSRSWSIMRGWRSTVWRCWAIRGTTSRPCTGQGSPSITWATTNVPYATCVRPRTANPQVRKDFWAHRAYGSS